MLLSCMAFAMSASRAGNNEQSRWFRVSPYLVDTLVNPIPLARTLFHDKITKEQTKADVADGFPDNWVTAFGNPKLSKHLTAALVGRVNAMRVMVENMPDNGRDSVAANQQKIQSLRAIWELLRQYNGDPRPDAGYYVQLVDNMHDMIVAANEWKSLDFVVANPSLATLDNAKFLLEGQSDARAYIYSWMGRKDPVLMLKRLEEFSKDTFAPAIISAAARQEPKLIFSYALSSNMLLKKAVYRTSDPYVQAIVQLAAESDAPLKALPFLSYIFKGTWTVEHTDSVAADPARSFAEIVKLRIANEPLTKELYTEELEYATLKNFVRQMNELHDTTDDVRFRCIDSLSPAALYYIMVYGREEIYTSSFLGTFKRMMERMPPQRGNELLASLGYDQFRSFIRLCAGYNTLSEFLGSMADTAKTSVMNRFIGGLEKGGPDDLEDAVNVADAFGSIKDANLLTFLEGKVRENYERSRKMESRKGQIVYHLLGAIINSSNAQATDTGSAAISARLKIPPVNVVAANMLANDTGAIFERVFFYGDEDGRTAYANFIDDRLHDNKWIVDTTGTYWSTVTSAAGKGIKIFANKPLKEPLDDAAIDSLDDHLFKSGIKPTVIIHRGHSYHVKTTLERIDTNARIVVLGSCGGYHNVATVLQKSHGAHIISSKQTGVGAINEPIIRAINTQLLDGKDVNWVSIWQELETYFSKVPLLSEKFADYIPPHRNLGVIFIKAYRQLNKD
ncbi:MAG: hypothetical protein KF744_16735 [Taibaiella sp.]|nr:hypothetical protein [Taibaiella sp.]